MADPCEVFSRFDRLYEDMQCLLCQMAEDWYQVLLADCDVARAPVPVSMVHIAPYVAQVEAEMAAGGDDWWDERGPAHVRALAASYRQDPGSMQPIILENGRWVDGRHRLLAAASVGIATLPAIQLETWVKLVVATCRSRLEDPSPEEAERGATLRP